LIHHLRRVALLTAVATVAGLCAVAAPTAQAQTPTANPFASATKFCEKHAPPPGRRNSSAPGITPSSIIVVEGSADVSNIARAGITPPPNEPSYKALFDEINDCGGINGRKIVMKRVRYNSSALDAIGHATANCLKVTEEYRAFLAINSTTANVFPRCISVLNKTILMPGNSGLFTSQDQRDAKGRILSRYPSTDQVSKAFVTYALKHSLFKGKKVLVLGVQREAGIASELTEQFVEPLKAKGVDAYLDLLPCITANNCRSQVGAVVSRAKAAGVETILSSQIFVTGVIGVLQRNMQEQNLRANIVGPVTLSIHHDAVLPAQVSDAGATAARFAADVGETAYTFNDHTVLGAWRKGTRPTAFGQLCMDTLNRRLKNNPEWGYAKRWQDNGFWSTASQACKEVRSFARALWTLGNNVTTERAVVALAKEKADRVDTVPAFDEYTWYSTAHPAPTRIAPLRYHYPCSEATPTSACLMPAEAPIRARPVS
jgi:ABC-type branched-subunit amino acid transport system substrate-binding protein